MKGALKTSYRYSPPVPSYAAFIGHQPHVSLAELAATVPGFVLDRHVGGSVVIFRSSDTIPGFFLDTLGGTVTLAEQLEQENVKLSDVPRLLASLLLPVKGKATFSLRCVGLSPHEVKDLYRTSKEALRKKGKPSRYVGTPLQPAASVLLREAKLTDGTGGRELSIIRVQEKENDEFLWIGMTIAAQDVNAYTKRDMEKPVRDTTTGLLPPKLAQVMLNLGAWLIKKPGPLTILDPFCGTGVIPLEALLRGWTVLASDSAEKAVTGCTKNIEWARKSYDIKKSAVPSAVWKQDAAKPFDLKKHPELTSLDLIVTETTLGPGLRVRPAVRDAQKLRTESEKLQAGFLETMAKHFPRVPIVCMWPVWYTGKGPVHLEQIWKIVEKLGYSPALPPFLEPLSGVNSDGTKRLSLVYRRANQFVGREIVMLKPRKK